MSRSQNNDPEKLDAENRRRIAGELNKNFLVEAAAGTGKTTSMVDRMVSLVASGTCELHKIAAVTFTRKAAAELRERFQAKLRNPESITVERNESEKERLSRAADHAHQAFVGTIHSFCATLLRERPVEFDIDPAFREITEAETAVLMEEAWQENIAALIASNDPLLDKLRELEIDRSKLKSCFKKFIEYRDVENWPIGDLGSFDLKALQDATYEYIEHMKSLAPDFPADRGNDKLMDSYEGILRASRRPCSTPAQFFRLLELFDHSSKVVQGKWITKSIGKQEDTRWEDFRARYTAPGMAYWCTVRYEFVVEFVRRGVKVFERLKHANGGLDFQDLLLKVARGLSNQPQLRRYFQARFPHLLVDEFQDTDPIQAEMMMFLTSENAEETDWTKCIPIPGSLFLVGDPKQSIYRFRRGDIVTFNRVKRIIEDSKGEILALTKNFRSRSELIEWNNEVYQAKFGETPSKHSPASEDMIHGRQDVASPNPTSKTLCGIYRLSVSGSKIEEATEEEAESIAKFIRHSIDTGIQVHRTKNELERGKGISVQASDFLIVPHGKKQTHVYIAALEKYGIPYEVSGGNPLANNPQLTCLIDCLRAIDDPQNPVDYLSVLRNHFGFSDHELYMLKAANGHLNYTTPVPESLEESIRNRLVTIAERFQNYRQWLRSMPYVAAVARIAEDLGLIMAAAATSEGNMQAGGLFKSMEWLRKQSWDFDSATDLLKFMEEILQAEDTDGCSAFSPSANVVRIMNLHKAKGLEAPIVFLANASQKRKGGPESHIDRSGEQSVGYMAITVPHGKFNSKDFATPANWSILQSSEQQFLDAENDRLLYVATTRAACAMIVSVGKDNSKWSGLHEYVEDAPELDIPSEVAMDVSKKELQSVSLASIDSEGIDSKWSQAMSSSYEVTTAKKLGLKGHSRPKWEASGDFGYEWGSAVHELLELHQKSPSADLRPVAHQLTQEYRLGVARTDELLSTVRSVAASEIWRRATASKRCFSELPIEAYITDSTTGIPTLIRGVIDLIFEESDAWTIVDYKTDDITLDELQSAITYYRGQLTRYAEHWTSITKLPVKSLGLYFTRINEYREFAP